jgi:DNA replication licensing factor MCM7
LPLRSLKSEQVGSVVSINAIVVKVSDVKPFIKVASYACDICGHELYQVISSSIYMPLVDCNSATCKNNQTRGKIYPQTRASKFLAYQELKVQEPSHQVPVGHVPRSLTVYALGESVKQCSPGDSVTIHGIYLPTINNNSKIPSSRLIHNTFIESFKIIKHKLSYKDTEMSDDMVSQIEAQKKKTPDIYSALAKSIAPEIYGMEDIKKALLLLLVGGVSKEMPDGMKIRGNINILLMGDPGVAKSQLLKHISHISPRGVYTTGKGSSGVGLTAAIVKDAVTSNYCYKKNFIR